MLRDRKPDDCYCPPGQCQAPVIMGKRVPCSNPEKAKGNLTCCENGKFNEEHECRKQHPAIAPEPQHTPKWKANKIIYPAGQDVSFEVLDESGDIVCQTIMREVATEKERIAIDAQRVNLFAAAPDMLSALKEVVRVVGGTLQGYGVLEAPMNAAKTAISKAEDFMEEARRTR